ncbi:MAG: ABC transporter ATP-binding protein [Gemmatimonadetes bacterium]|nr:ABC transporter ATP-binding protein [Gemmatimonadota bacterium]
MTKDGRPGAGEGPSLRGSELSFRYPGAAVDAVSGVGIEVLPGSMTALLGPNGSGKSTLLRLLAGSLRPGTGVVSLAGRRLDSWDGRGMARMMAVVPQIEHVPFPVTCEDLVAMGRYPHLGPWRMPGGADREAVDGAIVRCGLEDLRKRPFQSLSGGERQRVRIARALAQDPRILLLDEPTASLDMRYEMSIFRLLAALRSEEGVAVLVVTHHVNLAARFADHLVLLKEGQVAFEGVPEDVVTPDRIQAVFDWPAHVVSQTFREGSAPQLFPS